MSGFTDIFIRRPVLACVVSLLIVLTGVIAYFKLSVREFPEISPNVITITTSYPGADARLMENFVSTPIEESLGGVDGVDTITSTSTQNTSTVKVNFFLGYNIENGLNDINSRVSSIRWKLPREINDPVITKVDPNAEPTMYIGFFSDQMSPSAITDYLIRTAQPQVQTLPGVGEARLFGEREYAMRIWLNAKAMAAHNVTINDVYNTLLMNNVQLPAGKIESDKQTFNVSFIGQLRTVKDFNNLIVKSEGDRTVRIKDIGEAELGNKDDNSSVNINGKSGVVLGVIPKTNANPLSMAQHVRAALENIRRNLPTGLSSQVLWDSSIFIEQSISEVKKTLLETTIFVILVMFLFLGSGRLLLIPSITIPVSLAGAFALMWMMGFTINTLTLLAMVLAIGMVVDDAIVVVENIHRHVEEGKSGINAALVGARQIRTAVISMTLTLAAVYAPIGFATGLSGALFREFAFSLASAVIISGVVALTLSPMMCSKVLSKGLLKKTLPQKIQAISQRVSQSYERLLQRLLPFRFIILGFAFSTLLLGYLLFMLLPKELGPSEDIGAVMSIISAPASANLKVVEKNTQLLSRIFDKVPEKQSYAFINGFNGENSALSFLILKPWDKRKRSLNQVIASLMGPMFGLPEVLAFPLNPYRLPGQTGNQPIELVLKTTDSYELLNKTMQALMGKIQRIPTLANVDTDLKFDQPEFNVVVDRERARNLGISMETIGRTLNTALGEPLFNQFVMNGRSYYVIPRLAKPYQDTPQSIDNIYVRTRSQKLVPLSTVVQIKEVTQARSLPHFQQQKSATLTASTFPPGLPLGNVLHKLEKLVKQTLPKGVDYTFSGEARDFIQSKGTMRMLLIYALIFIYLTLSAQFESFRDPFIIITTVPLSTLGALLALYFTGGTINIYTNIGIVTLIGLISKHGILMVEFANQLQREGLSRYDAIIKSATIRFRPIMMTTLAMILGALPLALATGAGSQSRQQIGWAVVGGMTVGTIFSLLVVPAVYAVMGKKLGKEEAC